MVNANGLFDIVMLANNNILSDLLYLVIGLVVGGVVTFLVTRHLFNKQLKENPPITEKQIRQMFISMGQKPSESRIQQVLRSMGLNPDGSKINNNKGKK